MRLDLRTFLIALLSLQAIIGLGQNQPPASTETSEIGEAQAEYSKRGLKDIFEGEPGRAALFSLVLPGAGQAYNKRWWKVPIALGVEGYFIYNIIDKRSEFKALDGRWRYFIAFGEDPDGSPLSQSQIKIDRDDARQAMEYSWVFWGIAHLVVTLEAFINRHLMDFDISDDLSIKYKIDTAPAVNPIQVHAISVNYSF